jgi:hypothetical protein
VLLISEKALYEIIIDNAEEIKDCIKAKYATILVDLCACIFRLYIYSHGKISHELCKF